MNAGLSVVIATAHRRSMMLRFIDSLNAQTRLPEELVVADGHPSDDDERAYRERLRSEVPLRYLRCEMGLTRQRNRGIDAATRKNPGHFSASKSALTDVTSCFSSRTWR